MSLYIRSHDPASAGAKALSDKMRIPRIRHERSNFIPRPTKTVINWGSSVMPERFVTCNVINRPEHVLKVTNKKNFFLACEAIPEIQCVPFCLTKEAAIAWLSKGHTVCARQKLTGSSGEGLVLFDAMDKFVEAPLYTQYIKKKDEYRIHVMNGEVISVQRKALKKDFEGDNVDHRIRNLSNGFIFARDGVKPPEQVITQAQSSVTKLGLDFGAVDIIWNEKSQAAFVLEINSAPGLEGSTIDDYARAFSQHYGKPIPHTV